MPPKIVPAQRAFRLAAVVTEDAESQYGRFFLITLTGWCGEFAANATFLGLVSSGLGTRGTRLGTK
jgi:hypothetical protein